MLFIHKIKNEMDFSNALQLPYSSEGLPATSSTPEWSAAEQATVALIQSITAELQRHIIFYLVH